MILGLMTLAGLIIVGATGLVTRTMILSFEADLKVIADSGKAECDRLFTDAKRSLDEMHVEHRKSQFSVLNSAADWVERKPNYTGKELAAYLREFIAKAAV